MIVPTGSGAEIGGYAGDATPAANLLASVCDRLIVNPNVVNGAGFMEAAPNILYVEGGAIDLLMQEKIGLLPVPSNRIGILIDGAARHRPELLTPILNAVDAARTNSGLDIIGYSFTEKPVGARVILSSSGLSQGEVDHPEEVLKSAKSLLERGAQGIAIVSLIENSYLQEEELYRKGKGVDPIGGIEAILSHLVVKELMVPAAHAPVLSSFNFSQRVDPRSAAEEIGATYLPCILKGLSRSPRLDSISNPWTISAKDIDALILPHGVMGGVPALEALHRHIPIIVVEENKTFLEITPEKLGVADQVIPVANYLEAAGVLACMKSGIDWRMTRRPVLPLQEM